METIDIESNSLKDIDGYHSPATLASCLRIKHGFGETYNGDDGYKFWITEDE